MGPYIGPCGSPARFGGKHGKRDEIAKMLVGNRPLRGLTAPGDLPDKANGPAREIGEADPAPTSRGNQFSRNSRICFGSAFNSPFSTRFTISTSARLAGVAIPTSSPLRVINPFRNSISVRRPLTMS